MNTSIINTERDLKAFLRSNRKNVISINGLDCSGMYPMIEVTNSYASYYDVSAQSNKSLNAPFTVISR